MYNDVRKNRAMIRKITKAYKTKLRLIVQRKYDRIPRKLKKKYKKLWKQRLGVTVTIQRSSIRKQIWGGSVYPVWGCVTKIKGNGKPNS